ncbi:thioredoxin family protein [bacterium]|jgi:thioredoxin|nr:thioredoxin family protein [bacterium]MBT5015444.1 thioredoxin family protein [bacterium]
MKFSRLLFLPLILSISLHSKQMDGPELITTQSVLDETLKKSPYSVIKFTAPWCGACKSPIFNELAKDNADITFIIVDISKGEGAKIAKKYKVGGVPTFAFHDYEQETKRVVGDYPALKSQVAVVAPKAKKAAEVKAPEPEQPTTITMEATAEGPVKTVTSHDELNKHIKSGKPVIVKFYTNWCGYCKKIKPAFDKLASDFEESVTFIEVDGDKAAELADKFQVQGFPTFISFNKGKQVKEISGADKPQLESHTQELHESTLKKPVKAVKKPAPKPAPKKKVEAPAPKPAEKKATKKIKIPVKEKKKPAPKPAPKKPTHIEVTTIEELNKYTGQGKPTAVKFYASWCGPCQVVKPIFESLSKEYSDDMNFISINIDDARDIAQQYGVHSIPHIKIFKGGKEVDKITGVSTDTFEKQIKRHIK